MENVFKKIKRKIIEKFKRGFTLVELLAVIVILAIIMLIAIPAVLNTLESARRKTFAEYVDKVVSLTEQKELSNELLSNASPGACTIYDITKDLDLSSTGDYKGYTLVKKTSIGKEYIVVLWDGEFMLRPYNYTNKLDYSKKSKELSDAIEKYSESYNEELTISNLCGYGCKQCTTQSSETIKGIDSTISNVLKEAAKEGTYVREYTGPHQDSMDPLLSTEKIYYWYASSDDIANEILEKNNVLFAGFCWQTIRTTDTGGIKMIYNGLPEDGKCLSTRTTRTIGSTKYNSSAYSLSGVGYMYNVIYTHYSNDMSSLGDIKFSKSFTWDGSKYVLNNENSIIISDIKNSNNKTNLNNAHYTCLNLSGECTTLSYAYFISDISLYYINLTNGKSVEDAINEMLYNDDVNKYDSTIKTVIDTWYENNLASYSDYLEDTIFCYDRSQLNADTNGWNPNGGNITTYMYFKNYSGSNDLSCSNETDKFSTMNNKAKLKYKIGLMSSPEMYLINYKLRITNKYYWLGSPVMLYHGAAYLNVVTSRGDFTNYYVLNSNGVRPAVSLKPGTEFTDGDGSTANPYIVG